MKITVLSDWRHMLKARLHMLHRRLFARCTFCGERINGQVPRLLGYAWNGWLRREDGLYHAECLDWQIKRERAQIERGKWRA